MCLSLCKRDRERRWNNNVFEQERESEILISLSLSLLLGCVCVMCALSVFTIQPGFCFHHPPPKSWSCVTTSLLGILSILCLQNMFERAPNDRSWMLTFAVCLLNLQKWELVLKSSSENTFWWHLPHWLWWAIFWFKSGATFERVFCCLFFVFFCFIFCIFDNVWHFKTLFGTFRAGERASEWVSH